MTPIETLREAARLMRERHSVGRRLNLRERHSVGRGLNHPDDTMLAVADWLEDEAFDCESNTALWEETSRDPANRWDERGLTVPANVENHWKRALTVARAYLGGES